MTNIAAARVAALYDIHGNMPALEAVLRDVQSEAVDLILIGGDVLPGPMPRETLDCLTSLDIPVRFIRGNGDRVVHAQMIGTDPAEVPEQFREGIRWTAAQLGTEHEQVLAGWPATLQIEVPGVGEVLFCHATPRNDTDVFTRLTPEELLAPLFDVPNVSLAVCGHTHMQFDRIVGRVRVVNAGSVGMPYGEPGAYWLLLGPEVEFRHTVYDLADAAERIRVTGYPQADDLAANNVLQVPSADEALTVFTEIGLN